MLNNCTISDNVAGSQGGGILNDDDMGLINCTVTGNRASLGGGIRNGIDGSMNLISCTISGNTAEGGRYPGGGISHDDEAFLSLRDSIVAENTGPNLSDEFGARILFRGNNLIDGDPVLAPLDFYGGPTQTMPPDAKRAPCGCSPCSRGATQRINHYGSRRISTAKTWRAS